MVCSTRSAKILLRLLWHHCVWPADRANFCARNTIHGKSGRYSAFAAATSLLARGRGGGEGRTQQQRRGSGHSARINLNDQSGGDLEASGAAVPSAKLRVRSPPPPPAEVVKLQQGDDATPAPKGIKIVADNGCCWFCGCYLGCCMGTLVTFLLCVLFLGVPVVILWYMGGQSVEGVKELFRPAEHGKDVKLEFSEEEGDGDEDGGGKKKAGNNKATKDHDSADSAAPEHGSSASGTDAGGEKSSKSSRKQAAGGKKTGGKKKGKK
eukprot:CAMPEP_0178984522 /NCGR_PEP_ID=MMETSP0795-20121207/1653_1 /TAXON_ID=88552 /ORGANISM="Amoebophrya sp., Strain Ameob2" /LENGTH=265 /DNA_ID=CAMNT_0020675397 /DNA_START=95 /DNA_END=893 /DNA_ORIENTATION=+